MRRLATILLSGTLLSGVVAGCSPLGASVEAAMCDAGGRLASAKTIVEHAAERSASGDAMGASILAHKAAVVGERAHEALLSVPSHDVRAGATWQALLDAYLHIVQAANALPDADDAARRTAADELATGSRSLGAAEDGLPPACFAVPSPSASDAATPAQPN